MIVAIFFIISVLIYSNNGDYSKAVEYYQQALDLNSRLPQALNNIAVIYHYQGTKASEKKEFELAQNMFDKAKYLLEKGYSFSAQIIILKRKTG